MASRLDEVFFDDIHAYLRVGRWAEAVAFYERELTREERQDPSNRLGYAIALIREGRRTGGMKLLTNEITALPNAREQLRRYVIPHLMEGNLVEPAVALLERVLEAEPDSVEDHRLLGSLLGRMKRWDEAIAHAGQVIELRPNDYAGHTSYIQLLLQSGRASEAGAHAQSLGGKAAASARLANVALMALTRSGQGQLAAELATSIDDDTITEEILAGAIVRTLVEAGRPDLAITRGLQLLDHGWDHEVLRSNLAQAYLVSKEPDRYERAVEHLEAGLAISPNDPLMSYALGEALLRLRRYSEAIPPLAKAVELQPRVPQARALYARALKQTGRHAEAAQEFRTLLKLQPSSPRWHRYAAGALSQAGRQKEAAKLFDSFVAQRASSLPGNFEEGLDRLWQKIDELRIPQSRLDWAWGLRSGEEAERAEWDRRAKWGHLADHYLLDWLECRHDRIEEAMTKLADLDEADRVLGSVDRSRGMILASAHIGPMYAGPLALELLGVRSRWLASTPSVARTAYARSLISTSDQDDMQVAKSFMQSVREGYAVVIAVDGAINLGSPRIPFEGQEITYSSFAARTAHRLGVPSLFCAPYWDGERIGFVLERLPDASPEEEADDFADRWRDAFLSSLRTFLGGAPENLRLSGGIWRHIR